MKADGLAARHLGSLSRSGHDWHKHPASFTRESVGNGVMAVLRLGDVRHKLFEIWLRKYPKYFAASY